MSETPGERAKHLDEMTCLLYLERQLDRTRALETSVAELRGRIGGDDVLRQRLYDDREAVTAFDDYLASDLPLGYPPEKLFQGGIADSLTHIGQIAMLRRLAGCPIRGENYFRADIVTGRVGEKQSAPVQEFD